MEWNVNNLHRCEMSQKLPVDDFEYVKDTSNFSKDF